MKHYIYLIIDPSFDDGYYFTLRDWPMHETLQLHDSILIEEIDLDASPYADKIADFGLSACDRAEKTIREEAARKLAALQDRKAVYLSLPKPNDNE